MSDEPGPLAKTPAASDETTAHEIERKLELVGAVALLSVSAVMRALQTRSPGDLPEEQREALVKVRDDLRLALARVDAQLETGEPSRLDLSGLREKLDRTLRMLERWPLDEETPPS
ncbi:MAG TPA: hypothetical protein VHQ65_14070 [Thermoanaerobaculia bacterium]|nr:hypothetical protein [Thermoanaerobaculia bacterium]